MRLPSACAAALLVLVACGDDGGPAPAHDLAGPSDVADPVDAADTPTDVPPDVGPEVVDEPIPDLVLLAAPGELPGHAEQPTDRGRRIGSLYPHAGQIYFGYGDFDGNTGPIAVLTWDPATSTPILGEALDTEEILRFATLDGALYTANIDPTEHQGLGGAFRLDAPDEPWVETAPIEDAVHTFDVAAWDGRLYATTGCSPEAVARLAWTEDGGETWVDAHTTPAPADGGFARYYHLGATADRLLVGGRIHPEDGKSWPFAWVRGLGDESEWEPVAGAPETGLVVPVPVADALWAVWMSGEPGKGGAHKATWRLDGTELVPTDPFPESWTLATWFVEPGGPAWLVLVDPTGEAPAASLWRAEGGLDAAEHVIDLPELDPEDGYSAVGVLDDRAYLGTFLGAFWSVDATP